MNHLLVGLVVLCVLSCNVYRPLDSATSDEALLEEGLRCYHERDYDCAVAAYEKLSDSNLRGQKLCSAYLTQAGVNLSLFLTNLNNSDATMLGELAQALLPWTETKGAAATNGARECLAYAEANANNTPILLSSVAQLVDCAMRVARTDQLGDGSGDCAASHDPVTPGAITDGDIDYMCDSDATGCAQAVSEIISGQLSNAGLDVLKEALEQFPAALKDADSGAATVRTALKSLVKDAR